MLNEKKLIIFDMDGTLINSVGVWNDVDAELIKQLGGVEGDTVSIQKRRDTLLAKYKDTKDPYVAYCAMLGELCHSSLPPQEIHDLRYAISRDFLLHRVDYKDGVPAVLRQLKAEGKTLVIATTTRKANMDIYRLKNENLLRKAPLDNFFTRIYTKEDAKHLKPDPEIYLTVMKDFQVTPEECFVFEDSLIGMQAAKAAGIETAAIYDSYSEEDAEEIGKLADWYFASWNEVVDKL